MAEARGQATTVLEVSGVQWATEKNVAEVVLSRRLGVLAVEANPVAQTATVVYDPDQTSVAELAGWIRDCGYHCAGQSVPHHVCDPLTEPHHHDAHVAHGENIAHDRHAGKPQAMRAVDHAEHHGPPAPQLSPHEAMGHGGHGAMSMDDMVRDMR